MRRFFKVWKLKRMIRRYVKAVDRYDCGEVLLHEIRPDMGLLRRRISEEITQLEAQP